VQDVIEGLGSVGGKGDAYADFLKNTVRPLIQKQYGETGPVGIMGSSLGGLISLHIADREPGEYAFAASLSGTVGWGSIGDGIRNPTMIERYKARGHQGTVLYIDSGGSGTCFDSDSDGIADDDPDAHDNFCENNQLRDALLSVGYASEKDLFHWWEPGAQHNEAAWGARVFRPLSIFSGL
jgi:Putative esterase